jgi:hypothetical protein
MARQKLPLLLGSLLADPGPGQPDSPRFRANLTLVADFLQLLLDDGDMVAILRQLGVAFAPENGAADGALAILRRGLPADPMQVLLQLGRNLYQPDASGLYPAFRLLSVIHEVDRAGAGQPGLLGTPLGQADYQSILLTVGQFLTNEQRGGARLVDIIQSRTLP